MSNFLAIASVSAALRNMLQETVALDVPGAVVSFEPPTSETALAPTVHVLMYQVTPDMNGSMDVDASAPAHPANGPGTPQRPSAHVNTATSLSHVEANDNANERVPTGRLPGRQRTALRLEYLLCCSGQVNQLENQRLLGSVVRTLHERPILTRDIIQRTSNDATFPFLTNCDLAQEVQLVRFSPTALSLEQLSGLWSVFFRTPYVLSIGYSAGVVLLGGGQTSSPVLPPPQIESIHRFPGGGPPLNASSPSHADDASTNPAFATRHLEVRIRPPVTGDQRVTLSLIPQESDAPSYRLPLTRPPEPSTRNGISVLTFPIQGTVEPGTYLARIRVDRVDSALIVDKDRNSPTFQRYVGPRVTIR